ncbi:hypothetical protein [Eubacterium sp. 1001713B170207_170306_E7]|uniref:hypothetical protein n=1 Tax=Eubacterium sp. 1001713B170207_170306_E7 TaxID=2787097 RepID=UPI00189B04D2|nr:hypothetical protein [Eubacterium sp. 1001713B170207_170306_E7]
MKCSVSQKREFKRILAALLTVLMLWGGGVVWAEGNDPVPSVTPPVLTHINLKATGAVVNYSANTETLDRLVYDSLAITVLDDNEHKINFSRENIALSYNRSPGNQKVTVTYKSGGGGDYAESEATAMIKINSLEGTSVLLINSTPSVKLFADKAGMDSAIIKALEVRVVNSGGDNVKFSAEELELSYNRAVGTQLVTVKYKGNTQYNASAAEAKVVLEDPQKVVITLSRDTPSVSYRDDKTSMDKAITDALKVTITDESRKNVSFSLSDLELSYNHTAGKQDITVKYLGNSSYQSATATANVKIVNASPCALVLTQNPRSVAYDANSAKLDAAVLESLKVSLVDKDNKPIKYKSDELKMDYNRVEGDQVVKISFAGNDDYQPCSAEATVHLGPSVQKVYTWVGVAAGAVALLIVIVVVVAIVRYRRQNS